ncbi:hypothetical protein [Kitasatospora sp. NPDC088548]|uniref:hypothetical protein n=1 Tax=Kitasatospora sp. NPDC088548 TaxID=3364075 RepID=UPI0038262232
MSDANEGRGRRRRRPGGPQDAQAGGLPYPQAQHPYAPQQGYAPEPYSQQGREAQPYAPGTGHAPGYPQPGAPGGQAPYGGYPAYEQYGQQPHGQQEYGQQYGQPQPGQPQPGQAQYGRPQYAQPPVGDAATTLLPPVPPVDDAPTALIPPVPPLDDAPTALIPPVTAAAPRPAPASAPVPPPAPAPVFDPPTMTLKLPKAPAPPGAFAGQPPAGRPAAGPRHGVPAQSVPAPAPASAPAAPGARTGSPIIDPGLQPALITAGAAALLAAGAALGQVALALVVALLQALTAAGWFRLNGMWPARQGIALAALAGFTADAAVLLADSDGGAAAVVGALGGFFLLVLVLQTFRPSDPKERFYALTVLGSATVVTVLCTALLLADWVPAAVGAVALATVLAAAPLPGPKRLGPVLGVLAAVLLGLVVGAPLALGALAGLGALIGRRVAGYDFPSRFVHMTAGVALPLAVASPLIWIATRLLAG